MICPSIYCGFCFSAFGDVFAGIGVREPQPNASEAFTMFGEAHREIERHAIRMLKTVKPVSFMYGTDSSDIQKKKKKKKLTVYDSYKHLWANGTNNHSFLVLVKIDLYYCKGWKLY